MVDNAGIVGQATTLPAQDHGRRVGQRMSPRGETITMDWIQQASFDGKLFAVTLGTEDAPIASTTSIDDTLVWAVIDVPADTSIVPVYVQVNAATWGSSTLSNVLLEADNAQNRYSSGGSAFTPLNMNTGSSNTSGCTAYVGTDVTVSAKTSGGSIEFARLAGSENNVGTSTGAEAQFTWSARYDVAPVIGGGVSSFLLHYGAASADQTGYGLVIFAEFANAEVNL